METYFFRACGIVGLVLIISGIYARKDVRQDGLFAVGGLFLLIYSIHLHDFIFIILQSVFVVSSAYQVWKIKHKKILDFS